MPGGSVSKEDETTLSEIIRSIDKKVEYSLRVGSDARGPNLTLHLTRQGWEGTMTLGIDNLRTAKTDLVCRNKIRQSIKRLRDQMWNSGFLEDVLGTKAASMLRESGQKEDGPRRQFMRRPPRR